MARATGARDAENLGDALMLLLDGGYFTRLIFPLGSGPISAALPRCAPHSSMRICPSYLRHFGVRQRSSDCSRPCSVRIRWRLRMPAHGRGSCPPWMTSSRNGSGEYRRAPRCRLAVVAPRPVDVCEGLRNGHALQPAVPATPTTRYPIDSVVEGIHGRRHPAARRAGQIVGGRFDRQMVSRAWARPAAVTLPPAARRIPSGIRDYWHAGIFSTPEMTRPTTTAAAIVEEWARRPLDFEPGTGLAILQHRIRAGRSNRRESFRPNAVRLISTVTCSRPCIWRGVIEYSPAGAPVHSACARRCRRLHAGWAGPCGAGAQRGDPDGCSVRRPSRCNRASLRSGHLSLIDRSLLKPESYAALFAPGRPEVRPSAGICPRAQCGILHRGRLRIGHSGGGFRLPRRQSRVAAAAVGRSWS